MSALFDWSYELLTPDERVLFNRVAIFPASFTLDAAARACAAEGAGPGTVLDLVTSLTDKSLIVADTRGDRERYRLLESTREYALAKLTASGERERLARSHAEYFLLAAQTAQNSFEKMRLSEWLSGLEPEMENLRAAIDWALDRDQDVALGGSIAAALVMFWWHGGWSAQVEGLHWIQAALSKIDPGDDAELTAGLRRALGLLSSRILYS